MTWGETGMSRNTLISALAAAVVAVPFAAGCGTQGGAAKAAEQGMEAPPAWVTAAPSVSASAAPSPSAPAPAVDPVVEAAVAKLRFGYDPARDAGADINAALAEAKKDGKPVFIDFGADWCPTCKRLDKILKSASIKPLLATEFHFVQVDVGDFDLNLDIAADYFDLKAIPAIVILSPDGRTLSAGNDDLYGDDEDLTVRVVRDFLNRWITK
jgi:protein disulfide-isomerase